MAEGGKNVPLKLVARDVSADVALLRFPTVPDQLPEPIKLGWSSDVASNRLVTAFGYPARANKMVVTEGRVASELEILTGVNGIDKNNPFAVATPSAKILSRAIVFGGNSGGPLVSGEKAVGVVVQSVSEGAWSRATSVEHVRLLMDQARKHPDLTEPLLMNSWARNLGNGSDFKVKVEKFDFSLGDKSVTPG
jgi:S1-C subfamily serine protease